MQNLNGYSTEIIRYYNSYDEEQRFKRQSHMFEYLTTLAYIKKYLKPSAKILEIGAGTGAYSIPLAKQGYEVVAVDLSPKHVDIIKQNTKRLKNLTCLQADAINLSMFKDNTFDLVLNFGPMYHLFTKKAQQKAISESLRVCKKRGICMFAYISNLSMMWEFAVRTNNIKEVKNCIKPDGTLETRPESGTMFYGYLIEDFKKQFEKTNTTYLKNVAVDSIALGMRDYVDQLSKNDFKVLLDWHLKVCEKPEILGTSCHLLYICKKN